MKMYERFRVSAVVIVLLGGCNAMDDASGEPNRPPRPPPEDMPQLRRVVPTDERPVRQADAPPPAISGGTLLVSTDGAQAFVSDPDRNRVSVVAITSGALLHTVALGPGDEPGRLVQDDVGRVHVALRRGNAVATIDPATGTLLGRHEACIAPRGIAFDPATRLLHVACAGGELVSMLPDDGSVQRRLTLDVDLRDVMVKDDRLLVTRFKSAELIELDAAGEELSRSRTPSTPALFVQADALSTTDTLEPHLAWRTVRDTTSGGVWMVHQLARVGEIALPEHVDGEEGDEEGGGAIDTSNASPYGGAGACSGVVQTELIGRDPAGPTRSVRIDATLPVDLAVSPLDGTIAIAQAGMFDPEAPRPTFEVIDDGANNRAGAGGASGFMGSAAPGASFPVQLHRHVSPGGAVADVETPCQPAFEGISMEGQAVAVAYTPDGTLLVQTRDPAKLAIVSPLDQAPRDEVALGGESVHDTGHEIFHRDPGGGVACASCHGEGGDDGHVWTFSGLGQRRTQSVSVGLEGTAPFHWQGDMDDLSTLMEEVLVGRMGGVHQSQDRAEALQSWLFALQPPPAPRAADDPAAVRGHALFVGEAQCGSCHAGAKLTDNKTVDVGTGEPLQVPSLVGVAYRAPFIHDGCAPTLRDRFSPACGGAEHGKTADLSSEQIDDLVAYLESL
jgi:mono/diheme cytochrome c family protein